MHSPPKHPVVELKACIKSLDEMIQQMHSLIREFNKRPSQSSEDVPAMPHATSGPELEILDRRCESALQQALPGRPELIESLHVPSEEGSDPRERVLTNLKTKRGTLAQALNVLEVTPAPEKPKSKWRKAWERVKIVPRGVAYVGALAAGVVALVSIGHWVLGLF
jgi:hypothetical protein